jgi:hypothetical protein
MADKTGYDGTLDTNGAPILKKYTDQSGYWAEVVAAALAAGGSVTIAGPLGTATLAGSVSINETSATLYAGTLATSGSAAALATTQAVREVVVQNDPDNTADVLIGNSTSQTIQLKPGWSITIPVADLATVYAKSVSGTPVVNYLGRS